ncbi:MAG TPA: glycosyltransferase family 1 protein [Vicinamibacterales bacterium]|nr:glycosyltransferase family 1 protein [Vicinamibacterales bacterium]
MRILLDYRPALRQRTGVGEYAHELARAVLATVPAAGEPLLDLVLFSASWKDRLQSGVLPGAALVDRRLPNQMLNFAWHRLGWPPVETLAPGPFAVAHAFHPLLIPARRAAQVVTIADLDFLDHPERTDREIRRDYPALAAAHAKKADHVIVISEATARETRERLGVPPDRLTVCTPGAPAWPRREREPGDDDGCVLFLGTLDARKNLGVLLDAYERLLARGGKVPSLVLAGKPTGDSQAIAARTATGVLAGHVEMPGYVDDVTRQALYRRALIFVMPSHTEGFGMPVLEAMTVGVPVVVADRGALVEVAPAGVGRAFDPAAADQLAAILSELLTHSQTRDRMREAGWRQAARFSWRTSAERLRGAWQQAAARKAARG